MVYLQMLLSATKKTSYFYAASLPVLGLDELIVRHNLDAGEYIHPGSHPHDRRISRSFVAATSP